MQIQVRIAGTGAGPCDAQDSCAISWPFRVPLRGLGVMEGLVRSALSYAIQGARRGSKIRCTRLRKMPKRCIGWSKPLVEAITRKSRDRRRDYEISLLSKLAEDPAR